MQFGLCTGPQNAPAAQAAGWDFIEGHVQSLFKGEADQVDLSPLSQLPLPMHAANCLVPGSLKIVGPQVDSEALRRYMSNVLSRAGQTRVHTLVFGSGGARNVPDGFDREQARRQIVDFLRMAAPIAEQHDVTLVIEPLNKKECNIINSVAEAMTYVRELNHTRVRCLVDSYHFWLEDEALANLEAAMPWIGHVHLADKVGRTAPGESGAPEQSPYGPFFRTLKAGNYRGLVSVECKGFDIAQDSLRIVAFLRETWNNA